MTRQPGTYAIFDTSEGSIVCRLFEKDAPKTVANFVELAEGKREWTHPVSRKKSKDRLYDGTIFHRVIPDFMIQGGDPAGTGMGGPGYQFEDETKRLAAQIRQSGKAGDGKCRSQYKRFAIFYHARAYNVAHGQTHDFRRSSRRPEHRREDRQRPARCAGQAEERCGGEVGDDRASVDSSNEERRFRRQTRMPPHRAAFLKTVAPRLRSRPPTPSRPPRSYPTQPFRPA